VRILREERLQPDRAFEVEVVRRLVEQQHVGAREQHRGQRHPHPPAAGEVRAGPRLRRRVEAEPVQDRRRPRLGRMGVDVAQPRLDLRDPVGVMRRLGLRQQRRALLVGRQNRVEQALLAGGRLLRHAADAGAPGRLDLAAVERQLAPDQAEQRGLAGPVAPDEPHLVPRRDQRGGVVEEPPALHGEGDVLEVEHGRHVPRAPRGVNRGSGAVRRVSTVWAAGGFERSKRLRPRRNHDARDMHNLCTTHMHGC
jgi:hypothetical protein